MTLQEQCLLSFSIYKLYEFNEYFLVILFNEEHLHKLCLFCLANGVLHRESRLKENVRGTEMLLLAPAHFVRSFVMTTNSTLTKVSLCQSRLLAKSSNVFFLRYFVTFLTWNDFKNKSRKDRSSSPSVKNRSVCFVKLKTVFDNNELQLDFKRFDSVILVISLIKTNFVKRFILMQNYVFWNCRELHSTK